MNSTKFVDAVSMKVIFTILFKIQPILLAIFGDRVDSTTCRKCCPAAMQWACMPH